MHWTCLVLIALAGCKPAASGKKAKSDPLAAMPYLSSHPVEARDAKKSGVTVQAPSASPGLNLYSSRGQSGARLLDMEGKEVHRWESKALPHLWLSTEFDPRTGLLWVIMDDSVLARVTWDSKVTVVKNDTYIHHDVFPLENGDVWALTGDMRTVDIPGTDAQVPIIDEFLTLIRADGTIAKKHSMWELFGDRVPTKRLMRIQKHLAERPGVRLAMFPRGQNDSETLVLGESSLFDVFHANTIEVLAADIPGVAQKGDLLTSLRDINTVAIVDPVSSALKWSYGPGSIQRQHQPALLANGHILIFDNGPRRKRSRVLEIDPKSKGIVWQYDPQGADKIYSKTMGGSERLPNGHTLITESRRGRVLEISADGELVWEWFNPGVMQRQGKSMRATLFRMTRFPKSAFPALANTARAAP